MRFTALLIPRAYLVEALPFEDVRGAFETVGGDEVFRATGIEFCTPKSAHHSFNEAKDTLGGMHYQREPFAQSKLVSCISGAVWDVLVDLRRESRACLLWEAVRLESRSGRAVFVPSGCAHGFLTLAPKSTVSYLIDGEYRPESAEILRWDAGTARNKRRKIMRASPFGFKQER